MRINQVNQCFEQLTAEEFQELGHAVEKLVVHGDISDNIRKYFDFWCQELGYDDRHGLFLISTAFPQRALLSLVIMGELLE